MTDEEVNIIIASFMDLTINPYDPYVSETDMYYVYEGVSFVDKKYTKSLDKLISVWMKIGHIPKDFDNGRHWDIDCKFSEEITECAALASAIFIKEYLR
jgi:hypothetical protein